MSLDIITHQSWREGEEIYLNYGPLNNTFLYQHFGFCFGVGESEDIMINPFDSISISISTQHLESFLFSTNSMEETNERKEDPLLKTKLMMLKKFRNLEIQKNSRWNEYFLFEEGMEKEDSGLQNLVQFQIRNPSDYQSIFLEEERIKVNFNYSMRKKGDQSEEEDGKGGEEEESLEDQLWFSKSTSSAQFLSSKIKSLHSILKPIIFCLRILLTEVREIPLISKISDYESSFLPFSCKNEEKVYQFLVFYFYPMIFVITFFSKHRYFILTTKLKNWS